MVFTPRLTLEGDMSLDPLPPEKTRKTRFARRFQVMMILVFVLTLAYSGGWLLLAQTVRTQIETALADLTTPESEVNCTALDVSGFPFRFDVTCSGLSLTNADLQFTMPEIKATVLLYRPTHIVWFAQGPIAFADAFSGVRRELSWETLRGSARANGWALARVSVEGTRLVLKDTLLADTELGRIARLEAHALDAPEQHSERINAADNNAS